MATNTSVALVAHSAVVTFEFKVAGVAFMRCVLFSCTFLRDFIGYFFWLDLFLLFGVVSCFFSISKLKCIKATLSLRIR